MPIIDPYLFMISRLSVFTAFASIYQEERSVGGVTLWLCKLTKPN